MGRLSRTLRVRYASKKDLVPRAGLEPAMPMKGSSPGKASAYANSATSAKIFLVEVSGFEPPTSAGVNQTVRYQTAPHPDTNCYQHVCSKLFRAGYGIRTHDFPPVGPC